MTFDQRTFSILLIEDNPGDQFLISEYLLTAFSTPNITTVSTFLEMKEVFESKKMKFDIILLDVNLPDKSGMTLVEEALLLTSNIPIVILSGYSDISFSITSLSLGVSDYLIKEDLTDNALYKSIIYSIERSKIVKKFQNSEKRYSDLFYLSADAKIVINPKTLRIKKANNSACSLYGYNEQEFQQLTIDSICASPFCEDFIAAIHTLNYKSQTIDKYYRHKSAHGELFFVDFKASTIDFDDEQLKVLHINNITERIRFEQKLSQAILKTQESERHDIGSELHDNVCQLLATSQLNMSMFEEQLSDDSRQYYTQGKNLINKALDEIRILSHQLAPSIFDDSTLDESLSTLIQNMNVNNQLIIDLQISNELKDLCLGTEHHLHIFRILQEQLRNIIKYSKAELVTIQFQLIHGSLIFSIHDNGIGFDKTALKNGIGFSNIKRRVELLSGIVTIESALNQGCTINVSFPLQLDRV